MTTPQNLKQVALRLHGLHAVDRAWLLEQIPEQQRSKIAPLIRELDQMGIIHVGPSPLSGSTCPVGKFDLSSNTVQVIDRTPWNRLAPVFTELPDRLRAMLLHARAWRWSGDAWASLDARERTSILRHVTALSELRPAVVIALVDCVAETLRESGSR